MIPELGHFALALACAFAQFVLPIWGAHRRDARLIAAAPQRGGAKQATAMARRYLCRVTKVPHLK